MIVYYKANLRKLSIKKIYAEEETDTYIKINGKYYKKNSPVIRYVKGEKEAFRWLEYCLNLKMIKMSNEIDKIKNDKELLYKRYPKFKNNKI